MAEEQACLVRARSDSETSSKLGSFGSIRTMAYSEDRLTSNVEGGGDQDQNQGATMSSNPPDNNEGAEGDLIDYNDASVLEQFHEDAIRQGGCGIVQIRVILATGLAVAGAALEFSAVPFVLPSAEIELCILPHEKNWLVMISLMGAAFGAVGWGVLAERLGRRRTLLSCLAVNAVFASIAAFMPTYGTFMMARFCSAIGSGGIMPACYTYAAEMCPRSLRSKALALLLGFGGLGALTAALLAAATLPDDGADTLSENKEHFSAWHRYLLICTLPIVASLVSLIWTQESPRFLLDAGREVDAMLVYQNIHSSNQLRVCGVGNSASVNIADSEYRLGSLALPGKRRPPTLHHVRHNVKMFWQAFFQLFSNTYRINTLSLGGTLLCSMTLLYYLSSYVPDTVFKLDADFYKANKQTVQNVTFNNEHFNETLENIEYSNVTFDNTTFRDMLMSHVAFTNCTFTDVSFTNVKTSHTKFTGTTFVNSTIIDTDIEPGGELDEWCVLQHTVMRGMVGTCARHADLSWTLRGPISSRSYLAQAELLAALIALLPVKRPLVLLCGASILLSPSIYFVQSETALYVVEAVYRVFLALIFYEVGLGVVNSFPANLRCTAHGLILSAVYAAGVAARGAVVAPPALSAALCAALAAAATAAAVSAGTSR